jgi:hypothetical protein
LSCGHVITRLVVLTFVTAHHFDLAFASFHCARHSVTELTRPLCRIISYVLDGDAAEFRKSAEKTEKMKDGPSKEHLSAIKDFVSKSRVTHEAAREYSIQHRVSIVYKILQDADPRLLTKLTESQHTQCLEYLSATLSARDREEIIRVLCRESPDLFTQLARDQVTAMTGVLRDIHKHVDLSDHISSVEKFLTDLIATSKPQKDTSGGGPNENGTKSKNGSGGLRNGVKNGLKKAAFSSDCAVCAPSVEDYVELLRRNRHLLYRFLHEVASKCPGLRADARKWCNDSIRQFRQESGDGYAAKVRSVGFHP